MSVQYNYVHFYTIAIVVLLYHTIYTTQSVEHLKDNFNAYGHGEIKFMFDAKPI
jgi:hypothetical protein